MSRYIQRSSSRKYTATSDAYPPEGEDNSESSKEYDERASGLWQVYLTEAESHDKALIETWKDDMEGVILFAGLYSASLTAFCVESYKLLQPGSNSQTETLAEQTVFLLAQIATQIGANSTGLIARADPAALPAFSPTAASVRINICWFLSLVLSLTAALFATIVQQWVREYMQSSFQRYSSPLKSARIRQYLFEGANAGRMSIVVDLIPSLIHVSLFLFFAGLCDFLLSLNRTVAATTSIGIALSVLVYIWTLIAPAVNAQSPYQSPLSGVFWYLFQSLRRTSYTDNAKPGLPPPVSRNMADGRVQLAMHESNRRLERDARAIRWVVDNLTEDTDLEPFIVGIPGSLSTTWGKRVWETVANMVENHTAMTKESTTALGAKNSDSFHPVDVEKMSINSESSSSTLVFGDTVADLSGRITRLLRTCIDPGILEPRPRRARARSCVDAALALVLNMKGKWQWFSEADVMAQTLRYLAEDPGSTSILDARQTSPQDLPPPPLADPNFRSRWMCMSVMTVHALLQEESIKDAAQNAVMAMANVCTTSTGFDADAMALATASLLDKYVKKVWHGSRCLRDELRRTDTSYEAIFDASQEWRRQVEYFWNVLGWTKPIDDAVVRLTNAIVEVTKNTVAHIPGAVIKVGHDVPPLMPLFIPPRSFAERLARTTRKLRELQKDNWDGAPDNLAELSAPELDEPVLQRLMSAVSAGRDGFVHPFREQLWRLQDMADGGMLYTLELLIAAARAEEQSALRSQDVQERYVGTFRAVTVRWWERRKSSAVMRGIVVLLRDVLQLPGKEALTTPLPLPVPIYLVEELMKLTANLLKGTRGPHVDEAADMLSKHSARLAKNDPSRTIATEVAELLKPPPSAQHSDPESIL